MRLIDADAFERRCMFDPNIQDMQDVIYALRDYPTVDAVPVVRCKDCKYCVDYGMGGYYCESEDIVPVGNYVEPDGFCNFARRREE